MRRIGRRLRIILEYNNRGAHAKYLGYAVLGLTNTPDYRIILVDEMTNVYDVHALHAAMDVKGSQVLKNLRLKHARLSKELSGLCDVVESLEDSQKKLVGELDSLREEVKALSSKLEIADLERAELIKDFHPLATRVLNEVHGLGSSWDFKDIEDYDPEAEKVFDDSVEAFYKLEFLYISMLVKRTSQSLGDLIAVEPLAIQETIYAPP
ncbi:hypothetical protein Tco_0497683 [Tanacetum coccineum]